MKKEEHEYNEDFVKQNAVYALNKLGFPVGSIRFVDIRTMDSGMITFTHATSKARSMVARYLDRLGIRPIGRYGEWKYLWSDQSFLSGYNAVVKTLGEAG